MVTATAADPAGSTSEFSNTRIVLSPTADSSTVSGRVTTSDRAPISGALVTLQGGDILRRTITDSRGFYRFTDVPTDTFYIVALSRANYAFVPRERFFSLLANMTEVDFTGQQLSEVTNPLETTEFFVRQQYLDLLGRNQTRGT